MWKMINNSLKPNQIDSTFSMKRYNIFTSKPEEIAIAFNEFFSQVAKNLASTAPAVDKTTNEV